MHSERARYFLSYICDDQMRWFCIPVERRQSWFEFVKLTNGSSDPYTVPDYAKPCDGGLLTFEKPEIVA